MIKRGIAGRGTEKQPKNRFNKQHYAPLEWTADFWPVPVSDDEDCAVPLKRTQFFEDQTRTLLSKNNSPDLGFSYSLNAYRGCEHGCIYCYARPTHEYFGLSAGLDFESKIFVKRRAPELLRKTFASKRWQPQVVMMSGNTDCYQPAERGFALTRRCLEVFAEFRNPVGVITKNYLVTRDLDLLKELAKYHAVSVTLSMTTLDNDLSGRMEPRASRPARRLAAIAALSEAGVAVGVNVAPVIPGLNDHEMPKILKAASQAGASFAGHTVVRLPYAVKDLFVDWLEEHFPLKREHILNQIRTLRGGKLNDPQFGSRMTGKGEMAEMIHQLFETYCRRYKLNEEYRRLTTEHFRHPVSVVGAPGNGAQLALF